jgi:hypothetical protein
MLSNTSEQGSEHTDEADGEENKQEDISRAILPTNEDDRYFCITESDDEEDSSESRIIPDFQAITAQNTSHKEVGDTTTSDYFEKLNPSVDVSKAASDFIVEEPLDLQEPPNNQLEHDQDELKAKTPVFVIEPVATPLDSAPAPSGISKTPKKSLKKAHSCLPAFWKKKQ